jgi:hypothetical protein
LFTIIRPVVTYTVEPLNKPPARKYPITLSSKEVNRDRGLKSADTFCW